MMVNKFVFKSDEPFILNLPILSQDNITGIIDWGDNSPVSTYIHSSSSHNYEKGGTYTVTYSTTDFTAIASGFCTSNKYLIGAELDEKLNKISLGAFYNTINLQNISIPYMTIVENASFSGCSSLKSVTFGTYKKGSIAALESHGNQAFTNCTALKNISYYTDDSDLIGTTNNEYFILNTEDETNTYIPVNFLTTFKPLIVTDIPKADYIIAYDMLETNFSHNGLRILSPTSGTIKEELNGTYELTLEHPVDKEGAWLSLQDFNIIKTMGQLFRIYKKSTRLNSNGLGIRTVYAQHIWYDLAHKLIKSCDITGMTGQQALDTIHASIFDDNKDGAYLEYYFTHYSDILNTSTANFELTSPVACLIGEDGCFVNRLGGELYRDNFYYSICNSREGSNSNAFNIVHGLNMLEIEEVVDYSEFCTYLHTQDNYGNEYDVSYIPMSSFPHNYARGTTFNYNENNIEALGIDMHSYFQERWTPKITYTVKFANLHNAELYKDFINLKNFNIGDSGLIYSEELGISTTQKIISKTTDILTGEITSITLGNFQRSLVRRNRYANTISNSDNLINKIISPHKKVNVTRAEWEYIKATKTWHSDWDYNILEEENFDG